MSGRRSGRRGPAPAHRYAHVAAVSADEPRAGFYRIRLAKGAPWSPVWIWFGPSRDPETHELLDRPFWIWRAMVNGDQVPVDRVWPWCAGERIPESEWRYLMALHRHAVAHAPETPEARPRDAVDLNAIPTLF